MTNLTSLAELNSSDSDELDRLWRDRPDIMRAYVEKRPQYQQLVGEVIYILERRLSASPLGIASITGRAKTLKSLAEKIVRKDYPNPLDEITDLAGVRCVYLYLSDRLALEKIIESEFEVIEKIDKVEEKAEDEFGYGALHYIVKLGGTSSGARYDDLRSLICEIQVRTVLQDAWAIIDHHLIYKREKDAPKPFRRRLNSLSGLFETADTQFDQLRAEREKYLTEIRSATSSRQVKQQELNLDLFNSYMDRAFPGMKIADESLSLSPFLKSLQKYGYTTIADLDGLFSRTDKARSALRAIVPVKSSIAELNRALALENEEKRKSYGPKKTRDAIYSALHMVEKR